MSLSQKSWKVLLLQKPLQLLKMQKVTPICVFISNNEAFSPWKLRLEGFGLFFCWHFFNTGGNFSNFSTVKLFSTNISVVLKFQCWHLIFFFFFLKLLAVNAVCCSYWSYLNLWYFSWKILLLKVNFFYLQSWFSYCNFDDF